MYDETPEEIAAMTAAFDACRELTPAGRALRETTRELMAEIHVPAFMRRGEYRTPELMQRWRLLDDEADRQAARMVFAAPVQS